MKGKCEEACLTILSRHSDLFKELLARDSKLRQQLWSLKASTALLAVYQAVATAVTKEQLQKIIDTELIPRASSRNSQTKYTALRVLRRLRSDVTCAGAARVVTRAGAARDVTDASDALRLEAEARRGRVGLDVADAIQWCIESNSLYSEKLLQTAVLFFDNIPTSKRRDVVVEGLLNAPEDVRTTTTALLITESCEEGGDRFLPLWTSILECTDGDVTGARRVINDVTECALGVLAAAADGETPPSLPGLLSLVAHAVTHHPVERCARAVLQAITRFAQRQGLTAACARAAVAAHRVVGGSMRELCELVRLDKCRDEALLCESCYLLLNAPAHDVEDDQILTAVEILLTRRDVEPSLLSQSLHRLEAIMTSQKDLDGQRLDGILSMVAKLRTTKDMANKEARVLHRDVVVFLGKYGNNNYLSDKPHENTMIAELKDKLTLSIPNPEEGTVYKLNLQSILQLAISHEDPDALQVLLSIICAALSSSKDSALQLSLTLVVRALCRAHSYSSVDAGSVQQAVLLCDSVDCLRALMTQGAACIRLLSALAQGPALQLSLTLVIRALCRAHSYSSVDAGSIQHAVLLCDSGDCLRALMTYISEEKSPGVRKMLSDAFEGLLLKDPGSEDTEQLVKVAAEHATVMMASDDATVRSGGLNITETVLPALKDNHLLQRNLLPQLLTLILETEDLDAKTTFKTAYKILLENLEIYSKESLDDVIGKLSRNLFKRMDFSDELDRRFYKDKLLTTLEFFKEVPGFNCEVLLKNCKSIDRDFHVKTYVMAVCGWKIGDELMDEVLVMMKDLEVRDDVFLVEAVLKFLEVFSGELVEGRREMTLQAIGNIILKMPPNIVLQLSKEFQTCIAAYSDLEEFKSYKNDYQLWYQRHEIQNVVYGITKDNIEPENSTVLRALNVYLKVLKIPCYVCDDLVLNLCNVALDVYVENGDIYVETYKDYLCDMLNVSLRYKSLDEIREFLLKSFEKVGLRFLKCFVGELTKFLLMKPYILLEEDMKPICVIINDVLKTFLKKKTDEENCIRVLEFIDTVWPIYENQATFEDKLSLLTNSTRLPVNLDSDSAGMRWAAVVVAEGGREEGVKLARVLPGGEWCSSVYREFASRLPARLSEISGVERCALQALLDACSATADATLVGVLVKLCDCDQTSGWWDEAMASCMAVIARRGDYSYTRVRVDPDSGSLQVEQRKVKLMSIANTLFEYPSLGVCKRLLIPFLRYTTPSFCEQFFSRIINCLLSTLVRWVRGGNRDNQELRTLLQEHSKAFALITLAIEKIPLSSLKSPDSLLYNEVPQKQPSYLLRKASSICVTLRKKPCPDAASSELKECYRQWQVYNYKCLCAAVCVTRPAAAFYEHLFDASVWDAVFDCEADWALPLRSQWTQQKSFHTVADVPTVAAGAAAGTTRTRMFLRTLSENPLQFDLMDAPEEVPENSLEIELVINELNSQDGAETLTALLKHAASLAHRDWAQRVAGALTGNWRRNVKWTLAQMVCNCREELRAHSSALGPALVEMVAVTPREDNGRRLVNNLHVEVLETILHWSDVSPSADHISAAIEYVINTTIDHSHHSNLLFPLLGRLLDTYGSMVTVPWKCFEEFLTAPTKFKTLLKLLLLTTKHKIHIPELLPALVKLDEKLWATDVKLPELFGHALACGSETDRPLAQYRHFMDRKRQNDVGEYVKMLYYAQIGYPRVCDAFHAKKIVDLTFKVPTPIQNKCLQIIASYVTHSGDTAVAESLDLAVAAEASPLGALRVGVALGAGAVKGAGSVWAGRLARHAREDVRALALDVLLLEFEGIFGRKQGEPSAKRVKSNTSKLLSTLDSPDAVASRTVQYAAAGATDNAPAVAAAARERLAACMAGDDLKIRLAEAFYISICVPASLPNVNRSLSVCTSAFLEMFFKGLRDQERFKEAKLRDEPLDLSDPSAMSTKLLSNTRTYQGTFLSSMKKIPRRKEVITFSGINVQITIEDILATLLKFAKDKPDVSQTLFLEVSKSVLAAGSGFDAGGSLARLACETLPRADLAPLAVELGRLVIGDLNGLLDFEPTLAKLRQVTRCTEGEALVQLLHEEALLAGDQDVFRLGTIFEDQSSEMDVDHEETPSLEDLTSAFGKLSNWDKLTEQQKKSVVGSGLPLVWVGEDTFRAWLDVYQVPNTKSWFNKLVLSCRDECKQDSLRWLRETDRWPRRHFDVSVVTEALERQNRSGEDVSTFCDIRPSDCLVEWAARLMLRRAFAGADDSESSEVGVKCTADELAWCRAAGERRLPRLALNCVDVNASLAEPREVLSWRIEKATALRSIALLTNDVDTLGDALAILESNDVQLSECAKDDIIAMNKLTLALHQDLGSISDDNLRNIIETTNFYTNNEILTKNSKKMLCSLYEMAITHYDDVWVEDDATEHNKLLNNMADIIGHVVDLDRPASAEMFLSVLFNRLDYVTAVVDESVARNLLEKLSFLIRTLDDTSLAQIQTHSRLFPAKALASYADVADALSLGDKRQALMQQLRLVCDARHSLLRRCVELATKVNDPEAWSKAFELMKDGIFENPHAASSTEYNVLKKYKNELYLIEDYDASDANQRTAVLNKVLSELRRKSAPRATLRLSQLCPALAKYSSGSERDECMSRLLRLGTRGVVKFYEQVTVFTDAETRPVIIQALLTDGATRRYIHKAGDTRGDAAAQRAAPAARVTRYQVTPLGEDSGLIEYVEKTVRLRALINTQFDLADVDIGARAEDEELVLASASLEHHRGYCRLVPAHALRSAIKLHCSSTEDFINKKLVFLETLSAVTLHSWLFGLGDRHLENLLYCIQDGGVCCVDWSALFQYGVRELPPARLTRNLLAVCDMQVLEARLQDLVRSLRGSHKLFLNVVRVSFKWMGEEFFSKFPYLQSYARGEATSRDVTRQALLASGRRYRERLATLVAEACADLPEKEAYSVAEQVTCLLRHCTDPKILSVTRSGWEPWV